MPFIEKMPELTLERAYMIYTLILCIAAWVALEVRNIRAEDRRNKRLITHISKRYADAVAGRTAPSQVVKTHATAKQKALP